MELARRSKLPLKLMLLLVGVIAMLAFGLTAASGHNAGSAAQSASKPRIAVILPDFTNTGLILDQRNGALAAAK